MPNYLLDDIHKAEPRTPHVFVEHTNGPDTPWHLRLLCRLELSRVRLTRQSGIQVTLRAGRLQRSLLTMGEWDDLGWFIVLNGIADAWLWGFDGIGARLRHGNPACGMLGVLPGENGARPVTLDQSNRAPTSSRSTTTPSRGETCAQGKVATRGAEGRRLREPPFQPIGPIGSSFETDYWDTLAEAQQPQSLRFGDSYVLRYADDDSNPGTNFHDRLSGRSCLRCTQWRLAKLMCSPVLLCLYRVLEAVDQGNGKRFVSAEISDLVSRRFGNLYVVSQWRSTAPGVHQCLQQYRARAYTGDRPGRSTGCGRRLRLPVPNPQPGCARKDERADTRPWLRLSGGRRVIPILKLLARASNRHNGSQVAWCSAATIGERGRSGVGGHPRMD